MASDPATELLLWGALALALYLTVTDASALAVRLAGDGTLPALVHGLARFRFWPIKPGQSGLLDRLGTQMVLAAFPQLGPVFGLTGLYDPVPPVLAVACLVELLVVGAWTIYLVGLVRRSRSA